MVALSRAPKIETIACLLICLSFWRDWNRTLRSKRLERPDGGEDIVMGNLPMFHAFGMNVLFGSTVQREKLVLLPRFVEDDFLRCIQTHRITTVFVVPPIMLLLAKSSKVAKYDLSSLHTIWCGAAPLAEGVLREACERIGFRQFRQGYGMTEGTYAMLAQDDNHHKTGSVGVLLRGIHAKVVDVDTGKLLGPNQSGELHFKGDQNMKCYVGLPQETSATVDADGWLHTGDIGYYDEHGEWYIVDRIKELIKYKGFQVAPAEIEALLLTHAGVQDAGVVGVDDPKCGEKALAYVVKRPQANITAQDVIDFIAGEQSPIKDTSVSIV